MLSDDRALSHTRGAPAAHSCHILSMPRERTSTCHRKRRSLRCPGACRICWTTSQRPRWTGAAMQHRHAAATEHRQKGLPHARRVRVGSGRWRVTILRRARSHSRAAVALCFHARSRSSGGSSGALLAPAQPPCTMMVGGVASRVGVEAGPRGGHHPGYALSPYPARHVTALRQYHCAVR